MDEGLSPCSRITISFPPVGLFPRARPAFAYQNLATRPYGELHCSILMCRGSNNYCDQSVEHGTVVHSLSIHVILSTRRIIHGGREEGRAVRTALGSSRACGEAAESCARRGARRIATIPRTCPILLPDTYPFVARLLYSTARSHTAGTLANTSCLIHH